MIVIVDYGIGNLGSIKNMLRKLGARAIISSDPADLKAASKLILPGIGAFDTAMQHLNDSGLIDALNIQVLKSQVPVLGICLGAQMMTRGSEEGKLPGLGWFEADTLRMDFTGLEGRWPLPNIGWRDVHAQNDYVLLRGYDEVPRFYFVHSYYMKADNPDIIAHTAEYGFNFACGLSRGNMHCAQFHPEKSHKFGIQMLKNFVELSA